MRIHIAGAGVAGLASAIALAGKGHEVTLHEQANRLEAVGAGLQLGPNAVRALQALGAWDAIAPHACTPASIKVHDAATGKPRASLALGKSFESRFGAPYRVAHRADLLNALAETTHTLPGIELTTDQRLTGLDLATPHQPRLLLSGTEVSCDLAIGADGLRSTMRKVIASQVEPRLTGDVLYRALSAACGLPQSLDPQAVHMFLAPGAHVVAYMVSGGKRLNIVVSVAGGDAALAGWNALATRKQVMAAFPATCPALHELLSAPANWLAWAAADLEPFEGWSRGHAVLVGDAAHATLPHLAQGAAMSLEDAVALAAELSGGTGADDAEHIPAALARFEAARKARTSSIILASRAQGRIYKMSGPAALARNLAMRLMPPARQIERLAWVYEG